MLAQKPYTTTGLLCYQGPLGGRDGGDNDDEDDDDGSGVGEEKSLHVCINCIFYSAFLLL